MEKTEVEGKEKRKSEKQDKHKEKENQTHGCEENDVSENRDKVEVSMNMLLSSCDVTDISSGHKKKKKAKKTKHESDLLSGRIEEKTEGEEKVIIADFKDEMTSDMPPKSYDVTNKSGSHKKREKAKKQKHDSDLVTKKVEDETEGKEKEVNVKIGNNMRPSSGGVTEESGIHEKRKKTKKQKHESDLVTEEMEEKTEGKEKEVSTDVKDKIGNNMPVSSGDVIEEAGSHKKRKKAKKQKRESDLAIEKLEEKTEGKEKEVNTDVKDKIGNDMPLSSGDVNEVSGSHKKRKKAKKQKHESDLATGKIEEKAEGKEKEVNRDVREKIGNDMPPSSGDVTEESGSHKKRKKTKKQKHESDLATGKIEEKTEGKEKEVNTDVTDKIGNDMPPSSGDVTEESGSHKKRKKTKKQKHESDLAIEKMEEKTEGKEKEVPVNTDVKGKIGNNMPASSGDVTEESGSHKKRKKTKKHENDLAIEKLEEKTEGKEKEVNRDVKEMIGNDMPLGSGDVTKESGSHKKRKKAKKQKHESDLATGKIEEKTEGKEKEVNTDVKDKIGNDMPPSSGDVTEELGSHKKRKKAKKQKHESDLATEKMEEKTEGKEKEVNTDVKYKIGDESSGDITEESGSHKKRKKAKKRKHESDLVTEKMEERTEGKEKEISSNVKEMIGNDLPPNSGDITEESSINKKWKKAKEQKHESDLMEEKTEGKEKEVNADVKNEIDNYIMPPSICDVSDKSGSQKKRKKAKKRKHESDMSLEILGRKPDCEEKDAKADVKGGLKKDTPTRSCDVTEGSGSHKNMEKATEPKHENVLLSERVHGKTEGEVEDIYNVDKTEVKINENMPMSNNEVTKELGENMETENRLNAPSLDSSQEPTKAKHDAESTKEITNKLGLVDSTKENTVTIDVDKGLEKEETSETLEVMLERSELDQKKKIDDKTGNQWESAEFASVEQKEKFLRLMGASKPSTKQRETSNYSAMAMNKQQEKAFVSSLEKQYFQAMQTGKGVGLGYE